MSQPTNPVLLSAGTAEAYESRLKSYLDVAEVILVAFDDHARITLINRKGCQLLGYSEAELIGRDWFRTCLRPEDYDSVFAVFRKIMSGELKPFEHFENYVVTKSGEPRYIAWHNALIRDGQGRIAGTFSSGEDVTERRKQEAAARESEQIFKALFNSMFQFIGLLAPDGTVLEINQTALNAAGLKMEDVVRKPFWEARWWTIDPETQDRLKGAIAQCARGELVRYEVDVRGIGENLITIDFSLKPVFDEAGKVHLIIPEGRDITDRKQAEEQRLKMEAQMLQAQKMESLGLLAGGIAHDFNNLLTGMLGNVELALQDIPRLSPVRDNLLDIQKTARRAADLCRQMLAYSGKGRFVIQSLDLRELVREMGQILEVSISKKILLRYAFAAQVPPIEADPTQIRQVLMNMIINAGEAVGETAGVITISINAQACDRAYLDTAFTTTHLSEGHYVSLEISDTGCGMDEVTRERIFEPFFTTKFIGRGLGLAAVLGIVRGHKGAIKVYSEQGKGSTFKILFPAIGRPAEHLAEPASGSVTWQGTGTILLADDEAPVRSIGKRMMERMGFQVVLAVDGRDAVERFVEMERKQSGSIACVVLDLTMPHKNGEEVFREIRQLCPAIPIILSSGYNEQEVTQRFVGKGLTGFIQKPYQMKELAGKLQQALTSPHPAPL